MTLFSSSTACQSAWPPLWAIQVPPHSCIRGSIAVISPPEGEACCSLPSIISWT